MFKERHPGNELDQGMWKQFWFRHQKYHTFCSLCISNQNETTKQIKLEKEEPLQEWGAIMLQDTSKSMLSSWHRKSKRSLSAKDESKGKTSHFEISDDDEEEDIKYKWAANQHIPLSKESVTFATLWLRTARARLQDRKKYY